MIMMMIHSNSFGSNLSAEELGIKKKKLTIAWSSHSIEREFESSMWSLAFGFNNNLIIYLNIFPSLFWKGLLKELWQKYLPRPFNLEDKKNINNNSSLVVRFSLLLLILVCVCVCFCAGAIGILVMMMISWLQKWGWWCNQCERMSLLSQNSILLLATFQSTSLIFQLFFGCPYSTLKSIPALSVCAEFLLNLANSKLCTVKPVVF